METERSYVKKRVPSILLPGLLVCAIVPVAATITFGVGIPFEAAVVIGYGLQIVLVFWVVITYRIHPKDPWIALSILLGIGQVFTLLSTTFIQGSYEILDLANAVSKVMGILIFAALMQGLYVGEKELGIFYKAVLAITVLSVFVNVLLNGADLGQIFIATGSYELDFSSFFANRNQYGSFLFLSIATHALFLVGRQLRVINILLFGLQVSSLILTFSRGAILAMLLFLFSFCIFHIRQRPKYFIFFAMSGVLSYIVIKLLGLDTWINTLLFRRESGVSGRDSIWQMGISVWGDSSLLFGTGLFRGVDTAQQAGMTVSEFHSFFVETLVSGGIFELLVLVIILVIVWVKLIKSNLDVSRRYILYATSLGVLGLSFFESISVFTMGFVGTIFAIYLVSLPILYSNLKPQAV